jgi:hypothetical protein
MGALYVLGVLGVIALCIGVAFSIRDKTPAARELRNAKARQAYADAWFNTYPHEEDDGRVVLYAVHDGRPFARGDAV